MEKHENAETDELI